MPVAPKRGVRPAISSNSITPARRHRCDPSTPWPRHCSGDMYWRADDRVGGCPLPWQSFAIRSPTRSSAPPDRGTSMIPAVRCEDPRRETRFRLPRKSGDLSGWGIAVNRIAGDSRRSPLCDPARKFGRRLNIEPRSAERPAERREPCPAERELQSSLNGRAEAGTAACVLRRWPAISRVIGVAAARAALEAPQPRNASMDER